MSATVSAFGNSRDMDTWDNPPIPPNRWGTPAFVHHYFNGDGREVRLADVGLAELFERSDSVQNITNQFIADILNNPRSISERAVSDVTNEPRLFAVGNSTLFMRSECNTQKCDFNFSIRDRFADPLDINDTVPGETEIGTPYEINHDWSVTRKISR